MNIKSRRLLNKIKGLHFKLLLHLSMDDKKELEANELFVRYHNNINQTVLNKELTITRIQISLF